MTQELRHVAELRLASEHYDTIVEHGRRKLDGRYADDETHEKQAFGLLAGRVAGTAVETTAVFPLLRNMRHEDEGGFRETMDETVMELGVPSQTPLERRGWMADPRELFEVYRRCDEDGAIVYGTYHMHKVAWDHDPLRDTPTRLDAALVEGQGIWMLILSLVDPERPILRAFYEGRKDREASVVVGTRPRAAARAR